MGRGRSKKSGGAGAGGGGGGTGGGAFTVTLNANGGATITPANQQNAAAQMVGAGSGISDTNTHTTYFTPADKAIVSNDVTDGYRVSPRTGNMVPVGYYQTGDYANINGELRDLANGKITRLSPQTQKVVDAMDRNMRPLNNAIDSVRWTDMNAIRSNLGLPRNATMGDVVKRLQAGDIIGKKSDYTSSSWDPKKNAVAGEANRYVKVECHYAKGAMAQFSPTRKEGEMVGARNTDQRFSNGRVVRQMVTNTKGRRHMADVLVVDCYIDK